MPGHLAPAKKSLIEEIKLRLLKGAISPFEIAGFKKRAQELKSSDTDNAFAVLGIIACIEGDLEECRKHHENAIRHAKFPSIQISNYATSLNYIGLHSEALELALRARKADMTNMKALDVAVMASFNLGDEQRYIAFASEWKRLVGDDHPTYSEYLEEVKEANELTACCTYGAMQTAGAH